MSIEAKIEEVRVRHGLSAIHFFTQPIDGLRWTAFGHRRDPRGFQASVESGGADTIEGAVDSLDARIKAGPIRKPYVPILDAEPKLKD